MSRSAAADADEPPRASTARALSRFSVRLALLAMALCTAATGVLAAQVDQASEGKALFQQYCIGCHTIGGGNLVGPDLQGVTTRRDRQWLLSWIENPDALRASGDPTALQLDQEFPVKMLNLGLSRAQVEQIVAYFDSLSGAPAAASPAAAPALLPGDVTLGKDFFTGTMRFSGGGPACIACHSAGGVGALGGGQLGPDLTGSIAKFGEAGLDAFLANPPTQTMAAVWAANPLTPGERADVRAFLTQAAVTGRPTNTVLQLAAFAIVGTVLLLVIAQGIWRRRLRSVRASMVASARRSG